MKESGKVKALITGGSSGIGRDIATELAKLKYNLVIVARNKKELEEVAQGLREKYNIEVEVIACDLSVKENCIDIHNKVRNVDILINNAGFGDCGDFTKTDLDKELKMIDTNIQAYHILTKLYLIDMKKENKGKILNVASIAGFMPGPLMATYYSTKAYVVRLAESIRQELKKDKSNVQISILCPGPVDTNFNKVANVAFKLREADSRKVAKYAIKKFLKGKFYIVPGIDVKFARLGVRLIPTNLVSKITYRAQNRKISGK